jgi:myb proto-oncogene protein
VAKAMEMESHKQIHHASSSSDTLNSSPSLQNHATQDSQNYNITKEIHQSSLPKLLFAEWLSLDQVNGRNSTNNSVDSLVMKNGFDQNSAFQVGTMQEGPFNGEYHHSMFNSHVKFPNQMVGNGFVHCIPEVDLSNNFNLSNDAMYA